VQVEMADLPGVALTAWLRMGLNDSLSAAGRLA
jgi:hypothetical protein